MDLWTQYKLYRVLSAKFGLIELGAIAIVIMLIFLLGKLCERLNK